jgi:hypothetical protein
VKALLQLAAAFALLSLGAGVAVVAYDGHCFLRSAQLTVQRADSILRDSAEEWKNEETDIHSILSSAASATAQASAFAKEQRAQLAKTSRDSDNQVRAIGLVTRNAEKFFYNLDSQLNGKVLPDFDRELVSTSTAAQFSFESLTQTSDALTFQFQDPEWQQTLHSFNMAAASLSAASANGSSILAHGDHVAAYYDKKLTTPLGFWRTMVNGLLDVGAKAGSISAGFVR